MNEHRDTFKTTTRLLGVNKPNENGNDDLKGNIQFMSPTVEIEYRENLSFPESVVAFYKISPKSAQNSPRNKSTYLTNHFLSRTKSINSVNDKNDLHKKIIGEFTTLIAVNTI